MEAVEKVPVLLKGCGVVSLVMRRCGQHAPALPVLEPEGRACEKNRSNPMFQSGPMSATTRCRARVLPRKSAVVVRMYGVCRRVWRGGMGGGFGDAALCANDQFHVGSSKSSDCHDAQRGDLVAVGERVAVEVVEGGDTAPHWHQRQDKLAGDMSNLRKRRKPSERLPWGISAE